MNPETNRFEPLSEEIKEALGKGSQVPDRLEEPYNKTGEEQRRQLQELKRQIQDMQSRSVPVSPPIPGKLLRSDGSPVPSHWPVFTVGEDLVIRNYTFRVAHIGESHILFEPVGPLVVDPK